MRFIPTLLAVVLGIGVIWYVNQAGTAGTQTGQPTAQRPSPSIAGPARQDHGPAIASLPGNPVPVSVPAPASAKTGIRLENDIAILAGTADPVLALAAFQMIESCVEFQRNDTRRYDEAKHELRGLTDDEYRQQARYCEHITEAMKRDRLAYLDKAAKGGADGAALAFVNAGPFGDPRALETRPDDALVKEWKKQAAGYLTNGAHGGDLAAMLYLHTHGNLAEDYGISPILQRAATIATVRILTAANGNPGSNPLNDEQLPGTETFSKEQLAAARAMADDLIAAHQSRKVAPGKAP